MTTVVDFAGGGGLLLLMQAASSGSAQIAANIAFMLELLLIKNRSDIFAVQYPADCRPRSRSIVSRVLQPAGEAAPFTDALLSRME